MMRPVFKLPALYDKREQEEGMAVVEMKIIQVGHQDIGLVVRKYSPGVIGTDIEYDLVSFARLIAKAAYGMAVAKVSLADISETFIIPHILGERTDIGKWVGCESGSLPAQEKALHRVTIGIKSDGLIIGKVRLFAQFNSPEYTVIVGKVTESYRESRSKSFLG